MKKICLFLICAFTFGSVAAQSTQVYLKTEYINSASLLDNNGNKVEGNNGTALIYKGGVNLPLSIKIDNNNHPPNCRMIIVVYFNR